MSYHWKKKILHLNEGGSWLGNCKEGHSTKSLSFHAGGSPPRLNDWVLSSPGSARSQVVLSHFWGSGSIMGGGVTWLGRRRQEMQGVLSGPPGQVLPSRGHRGSSAGAGRRAAGLLLLWSDYGRRESIEQPLVSPHSP